MRDHRLEVDEAEGLIEFYEYGRALQLREKERCARMGIIAEDDDEKNTWLLGKKRYTVLKIL